MRTNRTRRLQAICWAITLMISALTVVSLYDRTMEYSGYGPKIIEGAPQNWRQMRVMNIPDVGVLFIPRRIPPDPDAELLLAQKCRQLADAHDGVTFIVAEVQRVNWARMLCLIVGATVLSAFMIQGSASLFVRLLHVTRPRRRQVVA
jgi:hypothetical protein